MRSYIHVHRWTGRTARGSCSPRAVRYLVGAACAVAAASAAQGQQPPADRLPAVSRLTSIIRESNPELAFRRAAVSASEARANAVGRGSPAALSAEIEEVPSGLDPGNAQSMRLELSKDFLPGGLRRAQRAAAQNDVDRARAELNLAERALDARVTRLLVHAVAEAAIAQRLAAEDSLLRGAEEGVRVRFAVGDARYVDVLRLRTERLRVQSDVASALTEARSGRRSLIALANPGAASDSVTLLVDAIIREGYGSSIFAVLGAPPTLDSLISISAALRLAEIEVRRARSTLQVVRAEQRPAIGASLGVQRFATEAGSFAVGPSAGVAISLPFTARRSTRAASLVAAREVAAAEAWQRSVHVAVRNQLASGLDRYESARSRTSLFDAALLAGARDERESAVAAFRTGQLSLLELLDFERALSRAEVARLESYIEAADAIADVITQVAEPMSRVESPVTSGGSR